MPSFRHQLKHVHHLVIGIMLLSKGWDKVTHHHAVLGVLLLSFGSLVVGYCLHLVRRATPADHRLRLMVHLFEGFALLFAAWVYRQDGKTCLPYAALLAGLGFLAAFLIHFRPPAATA